MPELDVLLNTLIAHAHALNVEITLAEHDFDFLRVEDIRQKEMPEVRAEIAKLRRVKFGDGAAKVFDEKYRREGETRPEVLDRVVKWVFNDTVCAGCRHEAREHTGPREECEYTACDCHEFESSISMRRGFEHEVDSGGLV